MGQYVMVEKEGLYQFNLCDSNGHVVLASTVYPSREECLAGMDSTRALAVGAPVQDGTVHGFAPASRQSAASTSSSMASTTSSWWTTRETRSGARTRIRRRRACSGA